MNIGIVMLNWNNASDTVECLVSLSKLVKLANNLKVHVLVVDNASIDQSYETINDKIKTLHVNNAVSFSIIKAKQNEGFSGGNNLGITTLLDQGVDYVLLLNNDVIVDQDFLTPLITQSEKNEHAIVGPKIYFAPGFEFHKSRYSSQERGKIIWYAGGQIDWNNVYCTHRGVDEVDKGQFDTSENTQFISGCCMLINREVFKKIGQLNEDFFLYYEDVDFCLRAKQMGVKLIYAPQSHIWHKNAQSSGKAGSSLHEYYQTRNRLIFGMKYAPLRAKAALIRESFRFIKAGGNKRQAVFDFYSQKYGRKK